MMVSMSPGAQLVYDVSCSDLTLTVDIYSTPQPDPAQPATTAPGTANIFALFLNANYLINMWHPVCLVTPRTASPSVLSEKLPEQRALWTLQIDRDKSSQRTFAKFHSAWRRS